jgi:hypothetical protein
MSMTTHMAARSAAMMTLLRHRGLRFGSDDDDRSMISAWTAGRSSVLFPFDRIAEGTAEGGGKRKATAQHKHNCVALKEAEIVGEKRERERERERERAEKRSAGERT